MFLDNLDYQSDDAPGCTSRLKSRNTDLQQNRNALVVVHDNNILY